jgi:hypothetical protein
VSADLVVSRNRLTALEEKTAALVNARISEAEKLVETTGLEALKENTLVEELMAETKRLAAETQLIFDKIAHRSRGPLFITRTGTPWNIWPTRSTPTQR